MKRRWHDTTLPVLVLHPGGTPVRPSFRMANYSGLRVYEIEHGRVLHMPSSADALSVS